MEQNLWQNAKGFAFLSRLDIWEGVRDGSTEALPYRRGRTETYRESTAVDQIVVDYIAGMTDDYFVELCAHLFPDAPPIPYVGYFAEE